MSDERKELIDALERHIQDLKFYRRIGSLIMYGLLLLVMAACIWLLVMPSAAQGSLRPPTSVLSATGQIGTFQEAKVGPRKMLPKKTQVLRTYTARVTVYMSTPGQTDADPFTTANGEHVYWGGAAMNCVPFGTKFRLPKVFGTKVFRVNDRGGMPCGDPDVWLPNNDFHGWRGTTNTKVEIVK